MSGPTWPALIVKNGQIEIVGVNLLRDGRYELKRVPTDPTSGRNKGSRARREARLAGDELRPAKGAGEVYVTGGGCFHTTWCSAVNGVWLSGAQTVRCVPIAQVRGKSQCSLCEADRASVMQS